MTFPATFKRDVKLDATLVHAGMRGLFPLAAMGLGLKPDEAFGRAEWFKKQPKAYRDKVVAEVLEMEKEDEAT